MSLGCCVGTYKSSRRRVCSLQHLLPGMQQTCHHRILATRSLLFNDYPKGHMVTANNVFENVAVMDPLCQVSRHLMQDTHSSAAAVPSQGYHTIQTGNDATRSIITIINIAHYLQLRD